MKIGFISDTHGKHDSVEIPEGLDTIVHSGDISRLGKKPEVLAFLRWYSSLPIKNKVLIAGNHDFIFEEDPAWVKENMPKEITYLENFGCVIDGVSFWGSPVTPWFHDWAFNRERGAEIRKYWDMIPEGVDVLITHGPPHTIFDWVMRGGERVGCEELTKRIGEMKDRPQVHAFGHIHEARGAEYRYDVLFVNASYLDHRYDANGEVYVTEIHPLNRCEKLSSNPE